MTASERWVGSRVAGVWVAALALVFLALLPSVAGAARTPVVFFPGYGTTVLRVAVHDQTSVKGCPRSGSFEDGIPADVGTTFSQACRDRLLTPRWRRNPRLSFSQRFSLPPGVKVSIPHYGRTLSAPLYQPFYGALEAGGTEPAATSSWRATTSGSRPTSRASCPGPSG